jgi:putative ABC transport system substrate-binding protein
VNPASSVLNGITQQAFAEGLRELGWVEGQNLTIERRFAEGHEERLPLLAAELGHLGVEALVAVGVAAARAARDAVGAVPIVFLVPVDPVETGLVDAFARPGGQLTGVTFVSTGLSAKRLEIVKEALPHVGRVAVLTYARDPGNVADWQETERAAQVLGVHLDRVEVEDADDLSSALDAVMQHQPDALIPLAGPVFFNRRAQLLGLAAQSRLPAMYWEPQLVVEGGLMAYGPTYQWLWRRIAYYVDRILKGASPTDLPLESPTRFEFAINLKTAQALGLTIPAHVLLQATEVLQ